MSGSSVGFNDDGRHSSTSKGAEESCGRASLLSSAKNACKDLLHSAAADVEGHLAEIELPATFPHRVALFRRLAVKLENRIGHGVFILRWTRNAGLCTANTIRRIAAH